MQSGKVIFQFTYLPTLSIVILKHISYSSDCKEPNTNVRPDEILTWFSTRTFDVLETLFPVEIQTYVKGIIFCDNLWFKSIFNHKHKRCGGSVVISVVEFPTSIFKTLYFLKWCPIFDDSLLHHFTKYNNFLLVYWFLGKNLSNFVSLLWKLNNRNNTTDQCWNLYSTSGPGNSAMAARDTEVTSISLSRKYVKFLQYYNSKT